MKEFENAKGEQFRLSLNMHTFELLRAKGEQYDIGKLVEEDSQIQTRLLTDPIYVCDVALALLVDQNLDSVTMDRSKFLAGISGDKRAELMLAVVNEIADFFPEPQRGLIQMGIQGGLNMMEQVASEMKKSFATLSKQWPEFTEPISAG